MSSQVYVFDPTTGDEQSRVRGVGRYLQLLKENFPEWIFTSKIENWKLKIENCCFINPFFNFLQPPLLMRRVAKKQIAVIHDLIPLKYPEHFPAGLRGHLNIFLNKMALKNYDLIITDSQASKKDIVKMLKIEENRVKVIYPCLPKSFIKYSVSSIQNTEYLIPNTKYCLYVGDATWNKNLVNLAKAIKIANVTCIFVGKVFNHAVDVASEETLREADCPAMAGQSLAEEKYHERQNLPQVTHPWQKEFRKFIELTKDDKRFIFPGFIDDYKLVKLYQRAAVNILVSRDEGFGFSYLEAANFSCPSILSNIPVLKEVSAGLGAIFAALNDPNDIAQKIKRTISDEELRKKLSLEAQQQSLKFSQEKFKKGWLTNLK